MIFIDKIIKKFCVTEKATVLSSTLNKYTFEVDPTATKTQIKETVEALFNVKVIGVSTVMRGRSLQRTGRRRTITLVPRKKKAVLTLQKGQTISLFDISGGETK